MLQLALPSKLPERSESLPKFLPKLPHIRISSKLRYNISKEYHKNLTKELLEKLKEQQRVRSIKQKERNSIYEIDAQKKKLHPNSTDSLSCVQLNRRNKSALNLDPKRLGNINIPLYEYSLVGTSYYTLTSTSSDLKNDYKVKMPVFALKEDVEQFPYIQTRSITNSKLRNPKMNNFKSELESELHNLTSMSDLSKSDYLHNHIKTLEINQPNRRSRLRKLKVTKNNNISVPQSEQSPQLYSVLSIPGTPPRSTGTAQIRPKLRINTKKHTEDSDRDSSPLCPFKYSDELEYNSLHDFTNIN